MGNVEKFPSQVLIRHDRVNVAGENGLQNRIATTLQHCSHNYESPQQFYKTYFYCFRSLYPDDYFGETGVTSRDLIAEIDDGKWTLKVYNKPLAVTIEETANHYMATTIDQLKGIPEDEWNAPRLQKVIQSILDDIKPLSKMVDSQRQQKQLDFHLFLRWALAAGYSGPSNPVLMDILGKAISLQRLENATTKLWKHSDNE